MTARCVAAYFCVNFGVGIYNLLHLVLFPRLPVVIKNLPKDGTIMDIGCGTGIYSLLAAIDRPTARILGRDLQDVRVATARKAASALKLTNVFFEAGDVFAEPLIKADAYLLCDVLFYLEPRRQEALLCQLVARLPKGGVLLLKDHDMKPTWKARVLAGEERVGRWLRRMLTKEADQTYHAARLYLRPAANWSKLLAGLGCRVEVHHLDYWALLPHLLLIAHKEAL